MREIYREKFLRGCERMREEEKEEGRGRGRGEQ